MERLRDRRPLHPLEPCWGVQPDFCRIGGKWRQARPLDDRCYASQSPSHHGQPTKKEAVPRRIGRTKGGMNSKLHAVCDGEGRPLVVVLSEGQTR
jgi:hypothetical protein